MEESAVLARARKIELQADIVLGLKQQVGGFRLRGRVPRFAILVIAATDYFYREAQKRQSGGLSCVPSGRGVGQGAVVPDGRGLCLSSQSRYQGGARDR